MVGERTMAGEAENYLVARAAFERVHAELTAVVDGMREVFAALGRDPTRFAFANVAGHPVPAEAAAASDAVVVDARRWQTPDQIMALLRRWLDAREAMRTSWSAVPRELAGGLVPPPAFAQLRAPGAR